MSTNNAFKSDLNGIYNMIQSSMIVYPKEMIIATLRDFFSKDSYYHYSKDQFGFANTTDHTDLPPGADMPSGFGSNSELGSNPLSTRLFIGENYRYNGIYYPAILVKSGGGKSVQISFNRNQGEVEYENITYIDGYGNQSVISSPKAFITAGAWEGQIIVDVITRSIRSRDDLIELISMCFTEITFDTLEDVGIIIKPLSYGSPSESDDRNDKLFRQSITLDIRTEWRRSIPIGNIIEAILFTANFGDVSKTQNYDAPNLTINTEVNLLDVLLG